MRLPFSPHRKYHALFIAVLSYWFLGSRAYTQVENAFQRLKRRKRLGVFLFAFLIHVFSTLDPFLSEIRVSGEGWRGLVDEGRFVKE